jgi:hypothetical protein
MSGTKNKIEDLRDHLFDTLAALKDPDTPMDINRAKAIANVANSIIHSAKIEADMIKVLGAKSGTGFIPTIPTERRLTEGKAVDPPTPAAEEKRFCRPMGPKPAGKR